jgi:hypothetical protein
MLWHGSPAVQLMAGERRLPVLPIEAPMRGIFVLLLVAGCGNGRQEENGLDQRSRDSTIGASSLPGAGGVRGALKAADSAAARNSRIDSLER